MTQSSDWTTQLPTVLAFLSGVTSIEPKALVSRSRDTEWPAPDGPRALCTTPCMADLDLCNGVVLTWSCLAVESWGPPAKRVAAVGGPAVTLAEGDPMSAAS